MCKCAAQVTNCGRADEGLDTGNGDILKEVGRFCYLVEMLSANGMIDSAVTATVRCAQKKFREVNLS